MEGGDIEDAPAEEVVAELLAGRLAPEVDQFAVREVEPALAVVLFEDELAVAGLLPDGAEEDRQVLVENGLVHSRPPASLARVYPG